MDNDILRKLDDITTLLNIIAFACIVQLDDYPNNVNLLRHFSNKLLTERGYLNNNSDGQLGQKH